MTTRLSVKNARCIHCGCADAKACPGGCAWVVVSRKNGTGVCTRCAGTALLMCDALNMTVEELLAVRGALNKFLAVDAEDPEDVGRCVEAIHCREVLAKLDGLIDRSSNRGGRG